jgi:hypothetical protein
MVLLGSLPHTHARRCGYWQADHGAIVELSQQCLFDVLGKIQMLPRGLDEVYIYIGSSLEWAGNSFPHLSTYLIVTKIL